MLLLARRERAARAHCRSAGYRLTLADQSLLSSFLTHNPRIKPPPCISGMAAWQLHLGPTRVSGTSTNEHRDGGPGVNSGVSTANHAKGFEGAQACSRHGFFWNLVAAS